MYASKCSVQPNTAQAKSRGIIEEFLSVYGAWVRAYWTGNRWQSAAPTEKLIAGAFAGKCEMSFAVRATRMIVIDIDAHEAVDDGARMHFDALASQGQTGVGWGWSKAEQRALVARLCAPVVEAIALELGGDMAHFRSHRGVHIAIVLPGFLGASEAVRVAAEIEDRIAKCATPDTSIEVFPKPCGEQARMCSFPAMGASRLLERDCATVCNPRCRAADVEALRNLRPFDFECMGASGIAPVVALPTSNRFDVAERREGFAEEIRSLLADGIPNDESWDAVRKLAAAFAFSGVGYEQACDRFAEYLEQVEHGSTRASTPQGCAALRGSFKWAMRKQCERLENGIIRSRWSGAIAQILRGEKDFAFAKKCAIQDRRSRDLKVTEDRKRWRESWELQRNQLESETMRARRERGRLAAAKRLGKSIPLRERATRRRITTARVGNVAMQLGLLGETVSVRVGSRLQFSTKYLPSDLVESIKSEFHYQNPDYQKAKYMQMPHWGIPKTIDTWIDRGDGGLNFSVPRGGAKRLRACFERRGIPMRFIDESIRGLDGPSWEGYPSKLNIELWDHQKEFIRTSIETRNCLQRAGTGAGKTTAAIAMAAQVRVPTLVVVHSLKLFDQWHKRLQKELGLRVDQIGVIQGGHRQIRAITLGMQQTLRNCIDDYAHLFGNVIQDEVQFAAAPSFFGVIDRMPAMFRVGVSASEKRKDGKEFLIYDIFGEVANEITYEELVDDGKLIDVEVRVIPTEFDAPWFRAARIARSISRATGKRGQFNQGAEQSRLLDEMNEDAERRDAVFSAIAWELKRGKTFVFFNKRREGCRGIATRLAGMGYNGGLLLGTQSKADSIEFDRTREGLEKRELQFGVGTYQAMGTGVDIPALDVGVLMHPIANDVKGGPFFAQVRGRMCRKSEDSDGAWLYYVWDYKLYGKTPLKNLTRWCSKVSVLENEQWVSADEVLKRKGAYKCDEEPKA